MMKRYITRTIHLIYNHIKVRNMDILCKYYNIYHSPTSSFLRSISTINSQITYNPFDILKQFDDKYEPKEIQESDNKFIEKISNITILNAYSIYKKFTKIEITQMNIDTLNYLLYKTVDYYKHYERGYCPISNDIFDDIINVKKEYNLITLNLLFLLLSRQKDEINSKRLYTTYFESGVMQPNNLTFLFYISVLINNGATYSTIESIIDEMSNYGLTVDIKILAKAVKTFDNWDLVLQFEKKVLDMGFDINIKFMNNIIGKALEFKRTSNEAIDIYNRISEYNVIPGYETFTRLLETLENNGDRDLVDIYFVKMLDMKIIPSSRSLYCYGRSCKQIYNLCKDKNIIEIDPSMFYRILIKYSLFKNEFNMAFLLFNEYYHNLNMDPSPLIYSFILKACLKLNYDVSMEGLFEECKQINKQSGHIYYSLGISACYKLLMESCINSFNLRKALNYMYSMVEDGIRPSIDHLIVLTTIASKLKDINSCLDLISLFKIRHGIFPTIVIYNILISTYINKLDFDGAMNTYNLMLKRSLIPNTTTYELLIQICAYQLDYEKPLELLNSHMKFEKPYPNTFNTVLKLLYSLNKTQEFMEVWNKAIECDSLPSTQLIDIFFIICFDNDQIQTLITSYETITQKFINKEFRAMNENVKFAIKYNIYLKFLFSLIDIENYDLLWASLKKHNSFLRTDFDIEDLYKLSDSMDKENNLIMQDYIEKIKRNPKYFQ